MELLTFPFNDFYENTYVAYDGTGECIIIDPGCSNKLERRALLEALEDRKLTPVGLINTHCHIDHVLGNEFVAARFNLGLQAHRLEMPVLAMQTQVAQMYGLTYIPSPDITIFLEEGNYVNFGETLMKILFVPGHAPGHICLYHEESEILIAGDTLFQGSIGRTDLPGGQHQTLLDKIQSELFTLPESTVVYPGHGESTTIGIEKKTNPFF